MGLSHRKICERARAKWDAASKTFCDWAIANGYGNVRRSDLESALANEPEGLRLLSADIQTSEALRQAESDAVSAGHAWRGTFGMVVWYSPSEVRRHTARRRKHA
ncbi:hypothetical protein BRAO375_3660055 [Bradyrhizobium sp. ORS 375]|nr:hypothetical protein BRAO375_3660055 [Bradyrhizobium sp. ORS 375]